MRTSEGVVAGGADKGKTCRSPNIQRELLAHRFASMIRCSKPEAQRAYVARTRGTAECAPVEVQPRRPGYAILYRSRQRKNVADIRIDKGICRQRNEEGFPFRCLLICNDRTGHRRMITRHGVYIGRQPDAAIGKLEPGDLPVFN